MALTTYFSGTMPRASLLLLNQKRLFFSLLLSLICTHAWALDYWQPLTDPNLRAVIATEDRIVAVGDPGYVVTSTNGVDWQPCSVPTAGILTSVAYGNGKYLAVGGKGDAIHSDDGINWHRTHLGVTNLLASVQFLGGQFVVSALEGYYTGPRGNLYYHRVLLSADLVDWKTITLSNDNNNPTAYFQSGIEVAGGYLFGGNSRNYAFTQDFLTWQKQPFLEGLATSVKKIIHTQLGVLVIGNYIVGNDGSYTYRPKISLSTNITEWQWQMANISTNLALSGVAYGHNCFVSVGSGGLPWNSRNLISRNNGYTAVSTNGLDWIYHRRPRGQDLYDICFFKDHFIAVGHRGLILRSTDGLEWMEVQPMRSTLPTTLHDVTFADGLFVAVGPDGIMTSTNGAMWDVRVTNTSSSLWSVAKGINGWVAVGDDGLVLHSPDSTDWQPQAFPGTNSLGGVAYGPNGYVAVSGNTNGSTIFHSADGHAWTVQPSPATGLFKVTYGGGYYVAVGSSNLVESADGVSWTTRTLTNSIGMTRIIYGNGVYFAGGHGSIIYSFDRTNWTKSVVTNRGGLDSHALAYGPAGLIAAGTGSVFESIAGLRLQWTHQFYGAIWHLGAAYGAGCYVIVGTQSYFSRNLLPRVRIASTENPASLRLSISTDPGLPFVLQSTESLDNPQWEDVPDMSGTNAYESFEISTQGNPQRFYRALPRP